MIPLINILIKKILKCFTKKLKKKKELKSQKLSKKVHY